MLSYNEGIIKEKKSKKRNKKKEKSEAIQSGDKEKF